MISKMAACLQIIQRTVRPLPAVYLHQKRNIKVGDHLPSIDLYEHTPDGAVNIVDLYKHKKGVLFAVLGAFTPGCSKIHIPDYLKHYNTFKAEGYDLITCVSVNDPFVMSAWAREMKTSDKIRMLSDPQAKFTKAVGMDIDCTKILGNIRSKKYSLVIEDSIIKQINVEPDHSGLACLLCLKTMREIPYS